MNKKNKVVVGLSGGVDSAVSAYLLKKEGYEVIGLFMQNWDSAVNSENNFNSEFDVCESEVDFKYAKEVANHLDIPIHKVEFVSEYWDYVFKYFIEEYKKSRTPNPDILCNKHIKFDQFLNYALKTFDADYIAMGHYAGVEHSPEPKLLSNKDENKDQTYFLCHLKPWQLEKTLFPLSNYSKDEVRKLAKEIKLPNFDKKDSTGICFIGERNFRNFLENYIPNQPGEIIDITTNKVVGQHIGTMYYTIGQRKGLNVGGLPERYFICKKDVENKIIYIAPDSLEEEYLFSTKCLLVDYNEITKINFDKPIYARFRHRQKIQKVEVSFENNEMFIKYKKQKNIVVGQFCVLYQDNYCLGGGIIEKVFKK